MLAHRRLDVLPDGEAGKQGAFLKQDPPALAYLQTLQVRQVIEIVPEDLDHPGALGNEPENRSREHGLSGARGPDEAKHLAFVEVEVEPVHHEPVAKTDLEAAHADDDLLVGAWRRDLGQ